MGLNSALQIGRTGLLTAQTGLQVTGNNLANAATPGYKRNTVNLSAISTSEIQTGVFIGRGVQLDAITRQVNEALQTRLRTSMSDQSFSQSRTDLLKQIEAIEGQFGDVNLSSKLGKFFDSWSALANNPQSSAARTVVISESTSLSKYVQQLDGDVKALRKQTNAAIDQSVATVNDLLGRVEQLNREIASHGKGAIGGAGSLRDQRDQILEELSQYMDISTVEMPSGSMDIYVGSTPIVMNGKAEKIDIKLENDSDNYIPIVVAGSDKQPLDIRSGQLGALIDYRTGDLEETIDSIDNFAKQLIWEVNRLHSQGQGTKGYSSITSTNGATDPAAALNSEEAELDFLPEHGSFKIHVTDSQSGQRTTSLISIDLDGIGADSSLNDIAAQLNAVAGVSATVTADGRLQLDADGSGMELSFTEDTSGFLASMGIGTFFTGTGAKDIGVNQTVATDTAYIAAGQEHLSGDNRNALAIDALRSASVDGLGGLSLNEFWNRHVQDIAVATAQANEQAQADGTVMEALQAQQQAVSGVNTDEEAINLMQYQQAYQASARYINVVNQLMETLMGLI
ncbi:flagellar hook-associated protein FlgK [Poriferisphaera sp. WC338]|uniref:flagellar hook-associated protein FlgK n=1 Tax=Poriferisphaera sp. WC338 TaxID=3425129 RepID=UPI003D812A15